MTSDDGSSVINVIPSPDDDKLSDVRTFVWRLAVFNSRSVIVWEWYSFEFDSSSLFVFAFCSSSESEFDDKWRCCFFALRRDWSVISSSSDSSW